MTKPHFTTADVGGVTLVTLAGDLEGQGTDEFRAVMDGLLRTTRPPRAVLDVSAVDRMSSYVVALVGFYSSQFRQARGRLIMAGASSPARRAFELSGLASTVSSTDTVDQAVREIKP